MKKTWTFSSQTLTSVPFARRELGRILEEIPTPRFDVSAGVLIFGELLANAVMHGDGGDFTATFLFEDNFGEIAVINRAKQFTPIAELPPDSLEHGRGLFIVRWLSPSMRFQNTEDTCRTSAILPLEAG